MRALKRWWRELWASIRLRPRVLQAALQLQQDMNLDTLPRFDAIGARGHDSIFFVIDTDSDKPIGVARIVNPHKKRAAPPANMPYMVEAAPVRLNREWTAYEKGAPSGLTPHPLWRQPDILMCEYLPFRPLMDRLHAAPAQAWTLLETAAKRICQLHALGITHMDMSLGNILADQALTSLMFVDFEYAPAFHVSPAAQRVYDHLRLIESAWTFIAENRRGAFTGWLAVFRGALDNEMREVDLGLLRSALGRVLDDAALGPAITQAMRNGPGA